MVNTRMVRPPVRLIVCDIQIAQLYGFRWRTFKLSKITYVKIICGENNSLRTFLVDVVDAWGFLQ